MFRYIVIAILLFLGYSIFKKNDVDKNLPKEILNVVSSRKEEFLRDIFNLFEKKTGQKIAFSRNEAPVLLSKLAIEKENSEADVLLTADVASAEEARKMGLSEVLNPEITGLVSSEYLGPENSWVAVSFRARALAYAKKKLNVTELLERYEYLADPSIKEKGLRLISSPIISPYNQFLFAYLIKTKGYNETCKWFSAMKHNLAGSTMGQGSDTESLKSIFVGSADLALVNSYYFYRLTSQDNPDAEKFSSAVGLFYPQQNSVGTHVNYSVATILKSSKHKKAAIEFVKFLLSPEVQRIIAEKNREFPVNIDYKEFFPPEVSLVKFDTTTQLSEVSKELFEVSRLMQECN